MKQLLLFSLFVALFYTSLAQDTVFLDKDQKVTVKRDAKYIRIVTAMDDPLRSEIHAISSGKPRSIRTYKDGELNILDGEAKYFYADGAPDSEGTYTDNKRNGTWTFYFPTGKLSGKVFFHNG